VASVWFDTLYDLVKTEQITPPVASRLYGVVAVALYEAIVPGSVQQRSLVGQLNALVAVPQPLPHRSYHWLTVANAALASTVRGLFPTASSGSVDTINGLEDHFASHVSGQTPRLCLHPFSHTGPRGRGCRVSLGVYGRISNFR
jgi:hypothetical protein